LREHTTSYITPSPQVALRQSAVQADASAAVAASENEIVYVRIMEHRKGMINPAALVKENILNPIAQRLLPDPNKSSASKESFNFFTGARRRDDEEGDDNEEEDDDDSIMKSFKEKSTQIDLGREGVKRCDSDEWHPKYKIPLGMFHIVESTSKKRNKTNAIVVSFKFKNRSTQREFIFDTEEHATEFRNIITANLNLTESRAKARLDVALKGIQLQKDEQLTFLVDICSGLDLPQCDVGWQSDPYVIVSFEGTTIHRTSFISNNANPIWTLKKGSLFIWKIDALELFKSHEGLVFEVKDYDAIGDDESLGFFNVHPRTLHKWPDNERKIFALEPLPGEKDWKKGRIAVRVRRATEYDVDFMQKYNSKQKRLLGSPLSPSKMMKSTDIIKDVLTKNSRKERNGTRMEYRVRPGPDPKRTQITTWLTKDKIDAESMKESHHWLDIGSGNLGKIYVEVIKCDKLPNTDVGGTVGNKTDAFVSLVYEDCVAETDIISNCLSPRWMPWSQRAFIFNMMHTSSQLFVAVFDSDDTPLDYHDLVGRISIDLSNFQTNMMYLLDYNLYPTAKSNPRDAKYGTITIRLRMELADERSLLLSNCNLPQSVYVNVHTTKEFRVLRQTVEGNLDMKKYSLSTITAHCDELMSYLTIYYGLQDAVVRLFLWRGGQKVFIPVPDIKTKSIRWTCAQFPLTSLIVFLAFINLVEKPDLLPSFFLASIGW
jgi:hypothetical protein